jgi:hypothetical protein
VIEPAKSGRASCRTCREKIGKGELRFGQVDYSFDDDGSYRWHHLTCAAKRRAEDVEAAYEQEAWVEGLEVPSLDELRKLREKAEEVKKAKKEAPYVERAPSGRSKCKSCGELIDQGAWRVALLREVTFGQQVRSAPINVHPRCVQSEILAEDCGTEVEGFQDAVRANTRDVEPSDIEEALVEIGELA